MINYLKADATIPQTEGNIIISHICNDIGAWGKGFVMAISKRWKEPVKQYKQWYKEAVKEGLQQVAEYAQKINAKVQMPRIGCGLAGGSWDEIEKIIEETLLQKGIEVFVCDI